MGDLPVATLRSNGTGGIRLVPPARTSPAGAGTSVLQPALPWTVGQYDDEETAVPPFAPNVGG
jgi:hypothetical protein